MTRTGEGWEPGDIGFERVSTPEYSSKQTEMDAMRRRFDSLPTKVAKRPKVMAFLERYGAFMSADNYRANNPEEFISEADKLIADGEALLIKLAKK
jgi:hypothetical protein